MDAAPSDDLRLHGHLLGRQGSRADLNTPVLVVEADALDRNIARMAALAGAQGVRLGRTPRPTRASRSRAGRSPPARWASAAPSWARPRR